MNAFITKLAEISEKVEYRSRLKILQVNMGNLCNQHCKHCHVGASPNGKNIMSKETIDNILSFLGKDKGQILDITGGAPEMNPNFEYFVSSAHKIADKIIVRSNLTVIFEPGKESSPQFYKDNKVRLICSLHCYTEENVDTQRGQGVYEKSIKGLKMLNKLGYGREAELILDLVYNPGGAFLPGPQEGLEKDYKKTLKTENNIEFNNLITITNSPIKRFKDQLEAKEQYSEYIELLERNFNKSIAGNIMCRSLLSVGYDGRLYDCDFNQALGMELRDDNGKPLYIRDIDPKDFTARKILFDDHCFSCTAGSGSSCQGALK